MTDTLFTFRDRENQAHAAKVAGIKRADENADPGWKVAAFDAILWCARMRPTFTSDAVVQRLADRGELDGANPAALGPVFLRAAKAGHIVKTGRLIPSTIPRRHRDLTEWRAA